MKIIYNISTLKAVADAVDEVPMRIIKGVIKALRRNPLITSVATGHWYCSISEDSEGTPVLDFYISPEVREHNYILAKVIHEK